MVKKGLVTKILAISGTVLAWLPILAPVLLLLPRLFSGRRLVFDYLMPAELFPVALLGGGLLVWAALRAHSQLRIIAWGLGAAVGLLVAGQALAMVTGLASGAIEPVGWPWALVLASLAGYVLGIIAVGVGGVLLVRELFSRTADER